MEFRMKKVLMVVAIAALALSLSGCKKNGGSSGGQASSSAAKTAADPPPAIAKFNENVQPLLTKKCAHPSCHGAAKSAGLQMSSGVAYENLVNVKSSEEPQFVRIKPGDPDSSYLVMKIEGKQQVGSRMPLTGGYLKTQDIQMIRTWVEGGAKKD
jgi:hypothetical protein